MVVSIILFQNMNIINIYFDGGTNGTPAGKYGGYGSWEVTFNGFSKKVSRIPYLNQRIGCDCSCNVAEYLSLLGALIWLDSVQNKGQYKLFIHGDSQLILNQISGEWKCRQQHLQKLLAACKTRLEKFGDWETNWYCRENNVVRFGH